MVNLSIYEDGNGGDLYVKNKALQYSRALYVACYLRMFGGQKEEITTSEKKDGYSKSWWGNFDNQNNWINSETERVLTAITITPSNINKLETAVKKDLKDLEKYGKIDVRILLPKLDRVAIEVTITQTKKEVIQIVWDATAKEVIDKIKI